MRHFGTYLAGTLLLCSCSGNQPDRLQLCLETENQHYCNDTILNKSGIPKTVDWQKEIEVIQ